MGWWACHRVSRLVCRRRSAPQVRRLSGSGVWLTGESRAVEGAAERVDGPRRRHRARHQVRRDLHAGTGTRPTTKVFPACLRMLHAVGTVAELCNGTRGSCVVRAPLFGVAVARDGRHRFTPRSFGLSPAPGGGHPQSGGWLHPFRVMRMAPMYTPFRELFDGNRAAAGSPPIRPTTMASRSWKLAAGCRRRSSSRSTLPRSNAGRGVGVWTGDALPRLACGDGGLGCAVRSCPRGPSSLSRR